MEGISIKYFAGSDGARCYTNWSYLSEITDCPNSSKVLERTFDLFLPLELNVQDVDILADIFIEIVVYIFQEEAWVNNLRFGMKLKIFLIS